MPGKREARKGPPKAPPAPNLCAVFHRNPQSGERTSLSNVGLKVEPTSPGCGEASRNTGQESAFPSVSRTSQELTHGGKKFRKSGPTEGPSRRHSSPGAIVCFSRHLGPVAAGADPGSSARPARPSRPRTAGRHAPRLGTECPLAAPSGDKFAFLLMSVSSHQPISFHPEIQVSRPIRETYSRPPAHP